MAVLYFFTSALVNGLYMESDRVLLADDSLLLSALLSPHANDKKIRSIYIDRITGSYIAGSQCGKIKEMGLHYFAIIFILTITLQIVDNK